MRAWIVVVAAALLVPGCLEDATREDKTIAPPTGPCAYLGADALATLVLVQVRRIAVNDERDEGPVQGVVVDIAKGAAGKAYDNATTDVAGCVAFRMQGPGLYEVTTRDGDGVCEARGLHRAGTDAENHLELQLDLQDPCA